MSLKNRIKTIIFWGLNLISEDFPPRKAAILMYHSVDYNPIFFTVKPENFQRQMDYLKEKKYNVISLARLIECIKSKNIPLKTVVLTFDDGYEDNYFNVFPILKKYNFPATFFLITGNMGRKNVSVVSGNIYPQILNWRQAQEMHSSGLIDFEPHTVSHPKLRKISLREAEREILDSRKTIEENLNKKCSFFAYPYGEHNHEIEDILERNGFLGAATVNQGLVGPKDNLLRLKRNSIDYSVDFIQFKAKLNLSIDIFKFIFRNSG